MYPSLTIWLLLHALTALPLVTAIITCDPLYGRNIQQADCDRAIAKLKVNIGLGSDPLGGLETFRRSRDPRNPHRVPQGVTVGSCAVGIDVQRPTSQLCFEYPVFLTMALDQVTLLCVVSPGQGGMSPLGDSMVAVITNPATVDWTHCLDGTHPEMTLDECARHLSVEQQRAMEPAADQRPVLPNENPAVPDQTPPIPDHTPEELDVIGILQDMAAVAQAPEPASARHEILEPQQVALEVSVGEQQQTSGGRGRYHGRLRNVPPKDYTEVSD